MYYYQVKTEFDNARLLKRVNNHLYYRDTFFIAGELLTTKEYMKLDTGNCFVEKYQDKALYPMHKCFQRVYVPKSKVYFFFGARFGTLLNSLPIICRIMRINNGSHTRANKRSKIIKKERNRTK